MQYAIFIAECIRMLRCVAMEPDWGVWFHTVLVLDLSNLACPPVFLVMMAHDSEVASNSTTVSE